eukprot:4332946-Pyramimonas_sp.AAC.1
MGQSTAKRAPIRKNLWTGWTGLLSHSSRAAVPQRSWNIADQSCWTARPASLGTAPYVTKLQAMFRFFFATLKLAVAPAVVQRSCSKRCPASCRCAAADAAPSYLLRACELPPTRLCAHWYYHRPTTTTTRVLCFTVTIFHSWHYR